MPGLFGILAKSALAESELRRLGQGMADSMLVQPWLATERYVGPVFCGGRVYIAEPKLAEPTGQTAEGKKVWFDGECYPTPDGHGRAPTPDDVVGWIADAGSRLSAVDGVYALAVFDETDHTLTIANDKLGYRPLYVAETPSWIAYASEVKALLALYQSVPLPDNLGVRQLFGFHHLLGERTLWKGIRLLPPASIWTLSARERHADSYWSFDEVRRDIRPERDVREEFGRLWRRAIARRQKHDTMPLLLSGGLDSRSVLAELTHQGADVIALTFGDRRSADVRIAAQVASLAGVRHRCLHPSATSWWECCEEAVWQTDGMVNVRHLPAALARDELHVGSCYTIKHSNANVLLGGHSLRVEDLDVWPDGVRAHIARRLKASLPPFVDAEELVESTIPDCLPSMRGPSPVAFAMTQGQRRWTLTGCLALLTHCEVVNPCTDLELLQLTVGSLDDRYRMHDRFYTRFLLDNYPQYYKNIPWQRTGRGLAESPGIRLVRSLAQRVRRTGRPATPGSFFDYAAFLKDSNLLDRLRNRALLADDVLGGAPGDYVRSTPLTRESANNLLNVLTLETYLRRVDGAPRLLS